MAARFFAGGRGAPEDCAGHRADPRDLPAFFHRCHLWAENGYRRMMPQLTGIKPSEADRWMGLLERGTPASLKVIAWIAERVGRRVARLFLYPITLYFLMRAHAARRASYEFLKRARGHSVHWWHVLRHFHFFAATILDRVYLLRGEFDRFSVTIHGKEVL